MVGSRTPRYSIISVYGYDGDEYGVFDELAGEVVFQSVVERLAREWIRTAARLAHSLKPVNHGCMDPRD